MLGAGGVEVNGVLRAQDALKAGVVELPGGALALGEVDSVDGVARAEFDRGSAGDEVFEARQRRLRGRDHDTRRGFELEQRVAQGQVEKGRPPVLHAPRAHRFGRQGGLGARASDAVRGGRSCIDLDLDHVAARVHPRQWADASMGGTHVEEMTDGAAGIAVDVLGAPLRGCSDGLVEPAGAPIGRQRHLDPDEQLGVDEVVDEGAVLQRHVGELVLLGEEPGVGMPGHVDDDRVETGLFEERAVDEDEVEAGSEPFFEDARDAAHLLPVVLERGRWGAVADLSGADGLVRGAADLDGAFAAVLVALQRRIARRGREELGGLVEEFGHPGGVGRDERGEQLGDRTGGPFVAGEEADGHAAAAECPVDDGADLHTGGPGLVQVGERVSP